jgi:predicted regulator of Ras-like GTPase activity (Roadblock/LC7/MglB family)
MDVTMEAQDTLAGLLEVPGISRAAVVSKSGQVVATSRTDSLGEALASLCSAVFGAVAGALDKGGLRPLDACLFELGATTVHMQDAGEAVLVALTTSDANVGRVKLALRRAAERLAA